LAYMARTRTHTCKYSY